MKHAAYMSEPIIGWGHREAVDIDDPARAGQISFDLFFRRERENLVRAVTLVVGTPSAAADVVDEALLRAYQRWPELSRQPRPGGWVYRVAVNLSRSRFRRLQREVKYRWLSMPSTAQDRTADEAFAARIGDDALLAAVRSLPIEQRTVVVARVLLDYSEAEVASSLEISPGTVKSRLSRGLDALRRELPALGPAVDRYDQRRAGSQRGGPFPGDPGTDGPHREVPDDHRSFRAVASRGAAERDRRPAGPTTTNPNPPVRGTTQRNHPDDMSNRTRSSDWKGTPS